MSKAKPILERQLITYPHPKYFELFVADCFRFQDHKANRLERILKAFYDSMSPEHIDNLRRIYDHMTPEQRKKPYMI